MQALLQALVQEQVELQALVQAQGLLQALPGVLAISFLVFWPISAVPCQPLWGAPAS